MMAMEGFNGPVRARGASLMPTFSETCFCLMALSNYKEVWVLESSCASRRKGKQGEHKTMSATAWILLGAKSCDCK